jgi:hypothetical protein
MIQGKNKKASPTKKLPSHTSDEDKAIAMVGARNKQRQNKKKIDESRSDGSGSAFSATEEVRE